MENFTLQAITNELQHLLTGLRVGKVYQFGVTDLALDFRLRDGRGLIVSTDPQRLALYLTRRDVRRLETEARTDTAFVSLLRKHLGGARLIALEKTGYDRVVRFDFEAFESHEGVETENETEGRKVVPRSLVIELIGRAANVLLLAETKVIATLRERAEASETYREPEPPARKHDPFDISPQSFQQLIAACDNDVAATARSHLIGFDQPYARELAARSETREPTIALSELLHELFEQPPQPSLSSSAPLDEIRRDIGRTEFSLTLAPITFHHLRNQHVTHFATINEAADVYFTLNDERRGFIAARQQIESALKTRLKKQQALASNLRRERDGYAKADQQQRFGELLLTSLHAAVKTERGFQVTDYYSDDQAQIEIPAAGKPGAKEAAEHYFKLARKARHGIQAISERLPAADREITELEATLNRLSSVITREQLAPFTGQPAKQQKAPASSSVRKKAREEQISGVRRYRSSDGYEILVGRSSRDNDHLTLRVAKSYDLWFHAADYPGSHVVLRNPKRREVPPRAITEAAQLAAKFSTARAAAKVGVNYCERKFVTKPKGFAPGQVRLSSFKTVLVEPKEAGERIL